METALRTAEIGEILGLNNLFYSTIVPIDYTWHDLGTQSKFRYSMLTPMWDVRVHVDCFKTTVVEHAQLV